LFLSLLVQDAPMIIARTILAALCALGFAATAATADDRVIGLTSFDNIQIEGDYIVEVTDGRRIFATASGERDALDMLEIEVRDRKLVIRRKQFGRWGSNDGTLTPVTIKIATQGLKGATLTGGGSLTLRGIDSPSLLIALAGPGRLETENVTTDTLSASLTGAGTMRLAGETRDLSVSVNGSGRLDARDLAAASLTLASSGSAASSFTASRTAQLAAHGIGRIEVFGNAPCTVIGKGTGNISCEQGAPMRD
jgi:hypothetical protein